MDRIGVIERAFQLARISSSLNEVRRELLREGYILVDAHLAGAQIRHDLKTRMKSEQLKD
jgi:hypothetical protein